MELIIIVNNFKAILSFKKKKLSLQDKVIFCSKIRLIRTKQAFGIKAFRKSRRKIKKI